MLDKMLCGLGFFQNSFLPYNSGRRSVLSLLAKSLAWCAVLPYASYARLAQAEESVNSISTGFVCKGDLSDSEWKKKLTPQQYDVMRNEGTEAPHSSPLAHVFNNGIYKCVGCEQTLFAANTKFDSGTGWPSFYNFLPNAVETRQDYKLLIPRTEVHCSCCGGHLGHVFEDGPKPTGLRYCINGIALKFIET